MALLLALTVACARLPGRGTPETTTVATAPTVRPGGTAVAGATNPVLPPSATPSPAGTPTPTNLALRADVFAPWGQETAALAVDGNPDSLWYSMQFPPNWFEVILKQPGLVERVELVVAQNPPGRTVHEVWLGEPRGRSSCSPR